MGDYARAAALWLSSAREPPARKIPLGGLFDPPFHRADHGDGPGLRWWANRFSSGQPADRPGGAVGASLQPGGYRPGETAGHELRPLREQRSLVGAQPHHSGFFELPSALETLPHYHRNPEHLFLETRAQGTALQAGPRKRFPLRHLAHRSFHLEASARHVQLHGMWPLLLELPRHSNQEAAGPTSVATRSAGLPLPAS